MVAIVFFSAILLLIIVEGIIICKDKWKRK